MISYRSAQSGQMLLMVILVMVVVMTVGLSVASRSIVNIKLAEQSEESQKAFQAAEAGINLGIKQDITDPNLRLIRGNLQTNANFETTLEQTSSNEFLVNNGDNVEQDVGYDIWLAPYSTFDPSYAGDLEISFASANQNECGSGNTVDTEPAIEVIILSESGGVITQSKAVFDSCSSPVRIVGRTAVSNGSYSVLGETFIRRFTISGAADRFVMRIIPLYNSTKIAVHALSPGLPSQGKSIISEGKSGESVRRLQYFESLPQTPSELFQYSIISQ